MANDGLDDIDVDWSAVKVMVPEQPAKMISIRIPEPVLAWYKARAGGKGYQKLMNRVLEAFKEQSSEREPTREAKAAPTRRKSGASRASKSRA